MGGKEKAEKRRQERRQEISLLRTIPYSSHQRWWSSENVAVVTGANRGIGFEIVKQFAIHGLTVVLTSRDHATGGEAAKILQEGGLNVVFHQLDILDSLSIKRFTDWIQQSYGFVDILVNNAGVNFNVGAENSVEFAERVVGTNYFGTKNMIRAMVPIMRRPSSSGARIVNVSSRLGRINGRRNRVGDERLQEELRDEKMLTEELVDRTVARFLDQVKDGSWTAGGWPQTFTDYSVSKLAVNAYTRVMARALRSSNNSSEDCSKERHEIYINCYCPGWVKTAMTGWSGNISTEEAADTGVWLALLPADQPVSGKFFAERRQINF